MRRCSGKWDLGVGHRKTPGWTVRQASSSFIRGQSALRLGGAGGLGEGQLPEEKWGLGVYYTASEGREYSRLRAGVTAILGRSSLPLLPMGGAVCCPDVALWKLSGRWGCVWRFS